MQFGIDAVFVAYPVIVQKLNVFLYRNSSLFLHNFIITEGIKYVNNKKTLFFNKIMIEIALLRLYTKTEKFKF